MAFRFFLENEDHSHHFRPLIADVLPNRMSGCAFARFTGTSGRTCNLASNVSFSDPFVLFVCFVVHRSPRPACLPWEHSATVANKSVRTGAGE